MKGLLVNTPRRALQGIVLRTVFLVVLLTGNLSVVYARGTALGLPGGKFLSSRELLSFPASRSEYHHLIPGPKPEKLANALQTPTCYILTSSFTGSGSAPVASPANSLNCTSGQYVAGESITMTASPAAGYTVGSWSGTDSDLSTSTTNTVTMPAGDHVVTVNYVACYTLTSNFTGSGSAPAASPVNSPGCPSGQYTASASITMTASPAAGYTVGSWSGTDNDTSTSTTNIVTMPASDHVVTVNYAAIPGDFTKSTPANGATGQPLSLSLTWGSSSNADSYEYCYSASSTCSNWTNVGTSTSATISGLAPSTTYSWHVRALNSFGTTYSDGSAASFWSFTTGSGPGAFSKSGPADGATGQPLSLSLTWSASTNADSYVYCYDTTNDDSCSNWISVGGATNVAISGLSEYATYYWHVRAVNSFGTIYSDGLDNAFWSFSTGGLPGGFNKSSPMDGATGQPLSLSLTWGASSNADSYEYCYSTSSTCSNWTNVGTNTSVSLSGLSASTPYSWHVRAVNSFGMTYSNGSNTTFWSFTTGDPPGAFAKSSPANGATGQLLSLSLTWSASSNATSYEYCYDTSNNNTCSGWISAGTNTSVSISGLSASTTYYWHVRSVNSFGTTYSNGSAAAFRSFATGSLPGSFGKSSPADGATGQLLSLSLSWGASSNTGSYEYCYDTSNDDACSNWISTGTNTSVSISGLTASTTYYWHVRAVNNIGTTYSNGSSASFNSFTTGPLPGAFNKSAPSNGATNQSLNLSLTWGASSNVGRYEYCYNTSNSCSAWINAGNVTSISIGPLNQYTKYYWHVRAVNDIGTTYSNNNSPTSFRSFTTGGVPGIFTKSGPASDVTNGVPLSLNLTWNASSNVGSYEYCYDTTNDNACSNWLSAGTNTSVTVSGLSPSMIYYWQVRAVNSFGMRESGGSFWSFVTQAVCPAITGWKGEYWANEGLSGPPVLCRDDLDLNFDWAYDSPGYPLPDDYFSVRWTRSVNFASSDLYRFYVRHDDGARLYIDGVLIGDYWGTCCVTEGIDVQVSAGVHTIQLLMYEIAGAAHAQLWWDQISQELTSAGPKDGWILESTETSGVGGAKNNTSGTFPLGDDAANRQYRSILSFNTSSLPDNAVITGVTLQIMKAGQAGTDPFKTHGKILVDVRKGAFAANAALQLLDFQAAASKNAALTISNTPVSGWYSDTMPSANFAYINKKGITQLRLRFKLDDNNDRGADYLKFYSGSYAVDPSLRPKLIITYYVP